MNFKGKKLRYLLFIVWGGGLGLIFLSSISLANIFQKEDQKESVLRRLRGPFSDTFLSTGNAVAQIDVASTSYELSYTLDDELESYIRSDIKRYRPDYVSVVVLDNDSGAILAAIDYDRHKKSFGRSLTFSSTHPGASLFKIVTAAELLENSDMEVESKVLFTGKTTTLYRNQLKQVPVERRWVRKHNMKQAFALSNNVYFGKAATNKIYPSSIIKTSSKLGFYQDLMEELDIGKSVVMIPQNKYELAELSSGFNDETMISPIHAALLAQAVANGGSWNTPYLISQVKEQSKAVWTHDGKASDHQALSKKTAEDLSSMMEYTIKHGTARGAFRKMSRYFDRTIKVGGKTGTITGGLPYGKHDWFVAYAKPQDEGKGKGISVSVMIVNKKKWYVKSASLAQEIINYYRKKYFL